jgi:hypothetical protein
MSSLDSELTPAYYIQRRYSLQQRSCCRSANKLVKRMSENEFVCTLKVQDVV